ncbi:MAG: peptidoglycan DD-metalloendopeptidase family protein [Parvularculaceae bacterium]
MDRSDTTFRSDSPLSAEAARYERGPAAVAVSILVMAVGAGFLALSIATDPRPAPSNRPIPVKSTAAETAPVALARVVEERLEPAALAMKPDRTATRLVGATPPPAEPEPISFEDYVPRLNPARMAAKRERALKTPRAIILGERFLAGPDDRAPPFFFASDVARRKERRGPLAVALSGDLDRGPSELTVTLKRGETFVDALKRAGVNASDRNQAAYAFGKYINLRALIPGQEFRLTTTVPNQTLFQLAAAGDEPEARLLALEFRSDAENRVFLKRDRDGGFSAKKSTVPLTARRLAFSGRIDGSLYLSAKNVGAPDEIIAALANIFAYDIDFQREIFGGDEFEAIFEARYDDAGKLAEVGDILFARLKWRGRTKEKSYYRFASPGARVRVEYYDAAGQSAKRLLMKTPIDGARLSSRFGTRRHPILGYARAHKGVDFAAPRGTPIKAAGDGVVERANRYGSFGNYIRIRHANGYKTAYAHLKAFRRGIRSGRRVEQGQIIGYVGTTGRSTGPHLHYEVHLKGRAVNPQRLKMATGRTLKGAELASFAEVRDEIDAMRVPHTDKTQQLLAKENAVGSSL